MHKKNKKCLNQAEKILSTNKTRLLFIWVVYHGCIYKRSARLFEHRKYHILTAALYCPERVFDKKIDICDTCLKHLSRNEMPFQTVFNKVSLDPMTDALKD